MSTLLLRCPKDIKKTSISFLPRLYFPINFCPLARDVKAKEELLRGSFGYVPWLDEFPCYANMPKGTGSELRSDSKE